MKRARESDDAPEQQFKYYLPGTSQLSTDPTIVERFLKTLFRRRGKYRMVVRREDR